MEEFLSNCQRAVKVSSGEAPGVHVVMGNEACDVDSMVSALVYAFYLSKTSHTSLPVVPVLNIRACELCLRSDNLFLLRSLGLTPERLVFRDQLDLKAWQRGGGLRVTLVDHNVLPSSDSDLECSVVAVIDHHQLERSPSPSVTVETVGSCATLVTERIIQNAPEILDQQIAHMLYAAIVLDCVDLSPSAGKVTPKDSHIVSELELRFPSLPQRGALFKQLQDAKFDVTGLNTEQMLLKDMKSVSGTLSIAVSVLYVTLEDFLQTSELEADLSSFCLKFGFDSLVLMSISFSETQEPIRSLGVFSLSSVCREQLSQHLERASDPALKLRPIESRHRHITAYQQGNVVASRKKLLPIVKDFLKRRDLDGCLGNGRLGATEEEEEEDSFPPTPSNSLVDGCPLDRGLPHISQSDLEEKFSKMKR